MDNLGCFFFFFSTENSIYVCTHLNRLDEAILMHVIEKLKLYSYHASNPGAMINTH